MPSMANITVKNSAAADVVYVAAVPSAGDRSPARWNFDAKNPIAGFRPTFTVSTRDNGQGSTRVLEANFAFPHTGTLSGVEQVIGKTTAKLSVSIPRNIATTDVSDAYVQLSNLLVSALIRQVVDTGYAPT